MARPKKPAVEQEETKVVSPEEIAARMDEVIHAEGDTDGEMMFPMDPMESDRMGGESAEPETEAPIKRGPGRPAKNEKPPKASVPAQKESKALDSVLSSGVSVIIYYDNAGKMELCNTYAASDILDKYKSIDAFVRTNLVERYGWGTYHTYKQFPDGKRVYSGSVRIRKPFDVEEKAEGTKKDQTIAEKLLELNAEHAREERARMERKEDTFDKLMAMMAMKNNEGAPAPAPTIPHDDDPMKMMSRMMAMKAMRDMMKEDSAPRDNGTVDVLRELISEVREMRKQSDERFERMNMQRQLEMPPMMPPAMPPQSESIKLGEIAELIRSLRPDASGNEVNKVVEIVDRMQGTLAGVYEKRFDAMANAMTTLADKFERALENRGNGNGGANNITDLRDQIRAVKELSTEFGSSGDGGNEVLDFLREMLTNLPELIGSLKTMNVGGGEKPGEAPSTLEVTLRNIHKMPDEEVPVIIAKIINNLREDETAGPMIEKLLSETPEDKRLAKVLSVLQMFLKKFVGEKVLTAQSASRILRIVKERGIEL